MIELKNLFLASVKDDWEIIIEHFGNGGDVGTEEWFSILRRRVQFLAEKIKENFGQTIIWSDIDVQFFKSCDYYIDEAIKDKDIVFMDEGRKNEVNCGFVVINCNQKTLEFYESILKIDLENYRLGDQSVVNELLKENAVDLKWGVLPKQFWAKTTGGLPPSDIVMHHANQTFTRYFPSPKRSTTQLKIEQLRNIKNYVALSKTKKVLVVLGTRKETPTAETLACLDSCMKQDYGNFSVLHSFAYWHLDDDAVEDKYGNIRLHEQAQRKIALASDADYFLLVDSDIVLPPHAISTLLSRGKDVIGGWFRLESLWIDRAWADGSFSDEVKKSIDLTELKNINKQYNASWWNERDTFHISIGIEPGITEVDIIDFGCTLISRAAYEKIDFKEYDGIYGGFLCVSFGKELQAAGYKLFMDSDVQCKHKGWEPNAQPI
jgi:cobalamin biosynthesis Co2+ chelatase CbiK